MNLKDYINMIIKLKTESKNGDFLLSIIDAFIRDPFDNEKIENPLLKYENSETLSVPVIYKKIKERHGYMIYNCIPLILVNEGIIKSWVEVDYE